MKYFIFNKKKLIYTNCINLGSFANNVTCINSSNFSLKYMYVKQVLGIFHKALHFLQFDIFKKGVKYSLNQKLGGKIPNGPNPYLDHCYH